MKRLPRWLVYPLPFASFLWWAVHRSNRYRGGATMTHPCVAPEAWLARVAGSLHQQGYRTRTMRRYDTVCRQVLQYLHAHAIALAQVDPAT
jgi:hypothetical protein